METVIDTPDQELIVIPGSWNLQFEHAAGVAASRFLVALRDRGVLLASPCGETGKIRIPPRDFCEDSFVKTDPDWIEVGPEGVIEAATVNYAKLPGYADPPIAIAYVRPDGADTAIGNFVEGIDLDDPEAAMEQLAIGKRMRATFIEKREGRITDFHWRPVA